MSRPVVVCDLDSTLCDTTPRHGTSPHADPTRSWDDYALDCRNDLLMPGVARLLQMLRQTHDIHLLSYRSGVAQSATLEWLARHAIEYDVVRLNHSGGNDAHDDYKVRYVQALQAAGVHVSLVIDDWPSLRQSMMEATGVPVLIVNPCYRDDPMSFFIEKQEEPAEVQ